MKTNYIEIETRQDAIVRCPVCNMPITGRKDDIVCQHLIFTYLEPKNKFTYFAVRDNDDVIKEAKAINKVSKQGAIDFAIACENQTGVMFFEYTFVDYATGEIVSKLTFGLDLLI